ncbi:sporulation integral membrane protein YlbJ [Bacillus chungangensis]|uniref:Sporulation integral membrane protein YlbJ n=1 Tax=Bacillus chungangensis TaxID=587633 RepID=A0ABT9WWL6_9BACI|nr:sporulation integral membrane protein YlbJ [Bacillus chungangensis]MDQ0177683.1 sporulation integral membrane protein YlbJ [Bacillus chungangensis]
MRLSKLKTIFLALTVTLMAASMIYFPKETFQASIRGLNMWWEIVFPSLFPFFVISEMLIGFGVVKFLGVLLEPLMRPLFRVPGVGGFAWAMGMATGFPAGAKLTVRLRQEGHLTQMEAERLVSFTNSSSPLFIFGAVSVGFFYNPSLGIILAGVHYLSNTCVGIIMRFHGILTEKMNKTSKRKRKRLLNDAFQALHQTRINNKAPIGKQLGDAVISSIQTLLMIGGFIILFSVINKLLFHLHITAFLSKLFEGILSMFHLSPLLSTPFIAGLFEITLGSQMTSQVQEASLMQQAIMTSFILGFSGFSVQAQVASILAESDIRFKPYLIARVMQACLAAIICYLVWKPIYIRFFHFHQSESAVPVFLQEASMWGENLLYWLKAAGPPMTIMSFILYVFIYIRRMNQ